MAARRRHYGILGGVSGVSAALGPLIGGCVTAYYTWRLVFAAETVTVLILMLFLLAWIRIATLLFALFYSERPPTLESLLDTLFITPESLSFLAVGGIIGGILALLAFSISVVSIPMLLDRDTNVFSAVATSVTAVRENPVALITWGVLIVLFIGAGMATAFLGLVVTLPLIGHASWHAYKDIVSYEGE